MTFSILSPARRLTIVAVLTGLAATLPAKADSYNDDAGLFEYFNNQKKSERNNGIVLERQKGRRKGTSTTLSLFGKNEDPLPDNTYRNNYSSRDWSKQQPTTILKFGVQF